MSKRTYEIYTSDECVDSSISERDAYRRRFRQETAEEVKKRYERESYIDNDHDYDEQR